MTLVDVVLWTALGFAAGVVATVAGGFACLRIAAQAEEAMMRASEQDE